VGQLNSGNRALRVYEAGYSGERLDVLLAPDPHILGSNPTISGNSRRLYDGQSDSACGSAAKVHQMPIVRQSVVGTVLTHRRHHDPIPKRDTSDRQRTEEIDFGHFPIMFRAGRAAVGSSKAILDRQYFAKVSRSHTSFPRIRESTCGSPTGNSIGYPA
jgi:hypothetical protein